MDCPWCKDSNSEVETGLCNMHNAERLGVTLAQYEKWLMDKEEVG